LEEADFRVLQAQADALVLQEAQCVPDLFQLLERLSGFNHGLQRPLRICAIASTDLLAEAKMAASGVKTVRLWPISAEELAEATSGGWDEMTRSLSLHLIYGMLPKVLTDPVNAPAYLANYAESKLLRDIYSSTSIRIREKLGTLLRFLAMNVGHELSYDRIAGAVGINRVTAMDYIAEMEQSFILKICPSFSSRLDGERKKGKKVYFIDNGIRNAVLKDFSPFSGRKDKKALWENFFYMERIKHHSYLHHDAKIFYWRLTGRKARSIDFVEVTDGTMQAFQCPLSDKERISSQEEFKSVYPECRIDSIQSADLRHAFIHHPLQVGLDEPEESKMK
jgi:predicted AAA+ superfamily ATPase